MSTGGLGGWFRGYADLTRPGESPGAQKSVKNLSKILSKNQYRFLAVLGSHFDPTFCTNLKIGILKVVISPKTSFKK